MYFYVDGKPYGPFTMGKDGFPIAGEVARHFRREKGYSAVYVASHLGDVSERWVLKMEHENRVPDSITRRRALCLLLGIPPMLLGLANANDFNAPETVIKTGSFDIDVYTNGLSVLWDSFHSGVPISTILKQVNTTIPTLRSIESKDINLTLSGYYRLASRLYREKGVYDLAEKNIEDSERYALAGKNDYLYASGLLSHGRTLVETGTIEKGIIYLRDAYSRSLDDTSGLHGTASIELAMALSRLPTTAKDRRVIEGYVREAQKEADAVTNDGSFTSLDRGIVSVYTVDVLMHLQSRQGIEDMVEDASTLLQPQHTWRHALLDILQAGYSLETHELYGCLSAMERAYDAAKSIDSVYLLGLLRELGNALHSRYGDEKGVQGILKKLKIKPSV